MIDLDDLALREKAFDLFPDRIGKLGIICDDLITVILRWIR